MIFKPTHFLLFIFSISCFSQDFTVNGSVKDDKNTPIAYANVVVIENSETLNDIVKGTSTDENGTFIISNLKAGNYTFKVSFLGYLTNSISVDIYKDTALKTIVLKENLETLDDVTVVAKRPTVKRLVDRLVFDVENSTLSNTNVLDVLKHTPGVLVHDGGITIKNTTPTVYINDRKVHLSSSEIQQLLEGTSATNVKSIEVITNPPAKYEAEGGAVLNIKTSKNIIAGYNGSVFGNYKQGSEFPKYAIGTNHFFKTKKLNTYVNYSINPRKDFRHNNEWLNFTDNTSWETDFKRRRKSENQNINANLDYDFNENNSLGFSTNILMAPRKVSKTNINSITEVYNISKALDSTFNTSNNKVSETFNFAFNLDYIHRFKRAGEKLSVSLHYTDYDFSDFQDVNTGYFLPNNNTAFRNNKFQTYSSQEIKLNTGQVDYELPISASAHFEAGAKISNINSESILNQFTFENGVKTEDLQNSDTFLYDELNYAAYTSYSKDWEAWSLKSGLRVEFTNIEGASLSTNQKNDNNYVKLFPSFHILNRLDENNELYFNYNKRIHRPRYSQLNPFKYFLNDNAYITGDPFLKPQIDNIFTLGYVLKNKYTFEVYYTFEKNPTYQLGFQDNNNNIIKYINTNIDSNISYGLDFTTYTKVLPRWNLYVLSSLFYYENKFFALESANELLTVDKWSVYAQIINYFSFLEDNSLTADISYLHISPIVDGASHVSSRSGFDVNLRKTLWNNRASVSIGVTDIFNTQNFTQTTKYLNQDVFFKSRMENRLITFGFNYKFGNFRLRTNKKEIELDERDRLGNTTN
ncbi:outer membrane beta-barrel family protein [Hwangdonia lutea]|uniref:Outer membrane beta-barrel family protein n=1 Tax=Hwangdonia lutea TaxID=3075823 RepID=A0AA97ENP0_9FLAO|nr:outer membrane beta-barrel family protein [Hwangdonia sp. SCSIO 19198]WOD43343.1 outer membrane beta-barrel family protein [Hwangdonia sp. SCSIO 19198]